MTTLEDLIRCGYFPKELPPPFNTRSLADSINDIIGNYPNGLPAKSKCCMYSYPRVGHIRRRLSIPNPCHQIKLFKCLSENWDQLIAHCEDSTISLSVPNVDSKKERAITTRLNEPLAAYRVRYSAGRRYLMRTDILDYYQKIYTHSIPWALHTKAVAKTNKFSDAFVGNVIDRLVRATQDDQTIGIPIGPDSSLLIAEIIGTTIDKELAEQVGELKGLRFFDDYYLYFRNLSDAEIAFSKLHGILSEFELELNPTKTEIGTLPESLSDEWVGMLSLYYFRKTEKGQYKDLIRYFSRAFEYSKQYPNKEVLKYAMSRVANVFVSEENWPLYESLLLRSIITEPGVLPKATEILYSYSKEGYLLNTQNIAETIKDIVSYHSQFSHSHEIGWVLWLSKTLGINIDEKAAEIISNVEDCIVALIALDLNDSGLIPSGLDTTKWETLMTKEELFEKDWLFVYEANVKGWLSGPTDHVNEDDFFSVLKKNKVEFYDPNEKVPSIEFKKPDEIEEVTEVSPEEIVETRIPYAYLTYEFF